MSRAAARQLIEQKMQEDSEVIGRKKKRKHPKNPKRVSAARANWKSNRAAIVAGMRKFWKSAEGKTLRAKIAKYRAAKESFTPEEVMIHFEEDVDSMMLDFFEEKYPELTEGLEDLLEQNDVTVAEIFEAVELMEEEESEEFLSEEQISEVVIRARKKRVKDPARSRLMKMVRARNKASYAKGAKKAAKTKKTKGIYKALGRFNAARESVVFENGRRVVKTNEASNNKGTAISYVNSDFEDRLENFMDGMSEVLEEAGLDQRTASNVLNEVGKAMKAAAIQAINKSSAL